MLIRRTPVFLILAFVMVALVVSCNGILLAPAAFQTATPVRPTVRPTRTSIPSNRSNDSHSIYTERINLDTFAPPGAGRDLVIMNCDYCHSWVCAVRGQRTLDHWVLVENVHSGRGWVLLDDQDWRMLFDYLEKNFNDRKPEPDLPPAFQLAGCTHSSYR